MHPCPPGFKSTNQLNAKSRDEACVQCKSGVFCEGADVDEQTCPRGHYCPDFVKRATEYPCPAGTYLDALGSVTQDSCVICPIAYYCPEGSATPIICPPGSICPSTGIKEYQIVPCPAGTFNTDLGQIACTICPKGAYCPTGSQYPQFCPPGTYNDLEDQKEKTDCKTCPNNLLCTVFGLTIYDSDTQPKTESGYLSPAGTNYGQQLPCPPGTEDRQTNLTDSDQCVICNEGFACEAGTASTSLSQYTRQKVSCEPGYYCPLATLHDKQHPCSGGTYSAAHNLVSQSQCLTCPAGYFCPPGSYQPYICPNGYFCLASTENFQHTPCKNGTYSYKKGLKIDTECSTCPMGYFCKEFTLYPEKCPKGTYNDGLGAYIADNSIVNITTIKTCKICTAGYMCPDEGTINPTICPAGTYSAAGSQTCFECQEGHDCYQKTGMTITTYKYQTFCPAGYICNGVLKSLCPVGYFCPGQTRRQHKCPAGKYVSTTGNDDVTDCLDAPGGYYTQLRGASSFVDNLCALGYYCQAGSNSQYAHRCPRGYYSNSTGQSACKTCPDGYFCNETSIQPIICPQGHYCTAGSFEASQCPSGTFGAMLGYQSSSQCQLCSPGQYCSQQGLSAPDGLCDPGYYCKEGAKVPNPTDGITGDVCQKGGFCEYGSKSVKECPPGTYNPSFKAKTQMDCIACPAGYYCQGNNQPNSTGKCIAGYYCPSGSTVKTQQPSPPGYYSLEGDSAARICDYGTYNPFTARSTCVGCKAGFYCDEQGMTDNIKDCPKGQYCGLNTTIPLKCPNGTYYNQYNAQSISDCKQCQAGKYCGSDGLINPTGDCEQGFYCISGALTSTPQVENALKTYGPCPKGYYCPLSTSYPIACSAGTFSSQVQAISSLTCSPCTTGYYCSLAGLSAPNGICDAGFYCPSGQKSPRPATYYCQPGQYCPAQSGLPTTVPAGYYQNMPYQSNYFQCPKGYYCIEGSSNYSSSICPAGFYCPAGTQYNISNPCPAGKYQPLLGQYSCVDCDPGKFCAQQNLTTPSGDCQPGYYCKIGSAIDTPTTTQNGQDIGGICQKGYYCPSGSAFMKPCLPGNYCGRIGLQASTSGLCQAGYYCLTKAIVATPLTEADGGGMCPPGFYCNAGSSVPLPCPVGKFSSLSGNIDIDNCTACLAGTYCESSGLTAPTGQCAKGYYCPAGSKSPRHPDNICPIGYQCPQGSVLPVICDTFTYQDVRGSDTCKTCPSGFQCDTTSIQLCGPQFYCPSNQERTACPEGRFSYLYNASTINDCSPCLPGYYCQSDAVLGIVVTPCPAGVYCQSEATDYQGNGPCPVGYYCPEKTSQPRGCPPGYYCDTTSLTEPVGKCDAGYYCSQNSTTSSPLDGIQGDQCPRGHYCPLGTFAPIACPIGTYNSKIGGTNSSFCVDCPAGFLCTVRGAENYDDVCPIGFYCPGNTTVIPCPVGFFCPARLKDPIKCLSGYYQPNTQQSACISCPQGFYCPQTPNATDAYLCPQGQYCPAKTETPHNCGIGTYNPFFAQISAVDCLSCLEGHYCATEGLADTSGPCSAGYYCKKSAISATPNDTLNTNNYGICKPGYYCEAGSSSMTPCPIGKINDLSGSTSVSACLACPVGFYCDKIGATSATYGFDISSTAFACNDGFLCTGSTKNKKPSLVTGEGGALCPSGYYCKGGVQIPCPIMYYNPNLGASSCLGCPLGKYCNETGMITPYDCPAGFYCSEVTASLIANGGLDKNGCLAGTYSDFIGNQVATDCLDCKEGKYCSGSGSQPDGNCASSYYCGRGSSLQVPSSFNYTIGQETVKQGRCPPGFYCPEGTIAPMPCPIGTWNPFYQRVSCDLCPLGHYCDEKGLDNTTIQVKTCDPGYYCILGSIIPSPTDNKTGRMCQPGHFCTGKDAEQECLSGTYEPRNGSFKCQTCYQGYICPQGSIQPKPCPLQFYCPAGAQDPVACPDGTYGHTTKLYSSSQCAACPTGKYCQGGKIIGDCAAGSYCDTGAVAQSDLTKLCPLSHYCVKGTQYPKRCPNGATTTVRGAQQAKQCQSCAEGFYCLENGDTQNYCPKGYYCLGTIEPIECPLYTYNNQIGRQTLEDCLECPPGYLCNSTAIADYKNYPCPKGYYCPSIQTKIATVCPEGTYNNIGYADNLTDCLTCPSGFYCPSKTINPIPCKNGTYCPAGSSSTQSCPQGSYCPSLAVTNLQCPASFYCINQGSDQYLKCINGTYCSAGSSLQTSCPNGYYGSSDPNNMLKEKGCIGCDAGFYSINGLNACVPCTQGYICLGNTSSSTPTDKILQGGYVCPLGYYCPTGSYAPIACPRGTFGSDLKLTQLSDCSQCSAGTYGDVIGLTTCKKCTGYTESIAGAFSCSCIGSNRVYLAQTGKCVCKTGFEPAEATSSDDSNVDCTEKVYDTCTNGYIQDQFGSCKNSTDCALECNGGSGTISAGLGICQCDNQTIAEDVCDYTCLANRKQVTFTSDGQYKIYDPVKKTTQTVSNISNVEGSVHCSNSDTSQCQLVSLQQKSNGDFSADFTIPTAVTNSTTSKRMLFAEFEDMNSHLKTSRRRSLQVSGNYITNPVVCMPQGSALLFENINKAHYPVYLKDSLINTNSNFDYSSFSLLAQKLTSGSNITQFIFSFQDSGIYVFGDSASSAKTTIIAIMGKSQKCPSGLIYEAKTQANLLKVGIAISKNIIYSPDWGFFIGIVAAVLGLILITVLVIGYVYRKSWAQKSYESIAYQRKHYSMIKMNDPTDCDAIISLNADTESFSFLNEGKDIARTREQKKVKDAQDKLDRKRKHKEKKSLDLEEVENLKDKLNKHLSEIKKLFGVDNQDDEEDNGLLENEEELRAQKLIDQISKLKDIIDENRRLLEGDELEDHQQTDDDKRRLEQDQKDREEFERKQAEEESKRINDLEYQRNQDLKQKKNQTQLDTKKDEVLGYFEKDMDRRKLDMLDKMEKMGVTLSKDEQDKMMEQFDDNLGKIGTILEDDDQYQQDLLKRKIEERKNRRKKLQDKLQESEKELKNKDESFYEKKEEIEQVYQDLNQALDTEISQEKIIKKQLINEDIERLKIEKLQNFEDLLKESKNTKDFGKVLDQYQEASKSVDAELVKERKKQEEDLDKALKNRKGHRRAQLEKEKAEKLKALQKDQDENTEKDRKSIEELKNLIALDEGTKQSGNILDKNIEKIIQNASSQTESQLHRKETLRDKSDSLLNKLKLGLMSKLQKMMQQHAQERKDMERKMIEEGKQLDAEVEKAQTEFSDYLEIELTKRDDIKNKLLTGELDEDERKRLLEELRQREESIKEKLEQQNKHQDNVLANKLKQRKQRKLEMAEQDRQMKSKQIQERELQEDIQNMEDKQAKSLSDRQNLDSVLKDLKMNLPAEELAYGISRALDEKHEAELNNMLVELFELKCRELQDEVFNLLEEKLHKQGAIKKEYKDKQDVVSKLESQAQDQDLKDKLAIIKNNLKQEEQRELQCLEWDYKGKEAQMERDVTERLIDKENARLFWLKEKQIQEKKEVFDEHLPENNSLKDILNEINDQEQQELEEFKREQEGDKIKKIQDLERQQQVINQEMQEQKERISKMEALNQYLESDEQKREREKQSELRRMRMQQSNMNSNAYIDKLKRDLEKINEQLDSALSQEKTRQLKMMQEALQKKMDEAERLRIEEEEKFRAEEEEVRIKVEGDQAKQKEEEEQFSKMMDKINEHRVIIDKKKYCGDPMESMNRYYEAVMRRKESQQMLKMQSQFKSGALANNLANGLLGALQTQLTHGLQETTSALGEVTVTKEQQLKMLNDILTKIETLELQVKKELYLMKPKISKISSGKQSFMKVYDESMMSSRRQIRDDTSSKLNGLRSREPSVIKLNK